MSTALRQRRAPDREYERLLEDLEMTVRAMTIYANEGFANDRSPFAWLNITADNYHATFMIRPDEIDLFSRVPEADGNDRKRKTIMIGLCGGLSAFWCSDADGIHVVIGIDDESWDIGLTLPPGALSQISDSLNALRN